MGGAARWPIAGLLAFREETLDGFVDVFLGVDAVGDEVGGVGELVVEDVDEVAGAVGAGDLAVAEEVDLGEEGVEEEAAAVAGVGFGAVVAVGEVEEVDGPLVGGVVSFEELAGGFEGGGDFGAAVFAEVVEGLLVDFAGGDVVDDVAGFDAFVVSAEPGVDPERLDANQFLLLIAHGARDIHHVDDDGVGLRREHFLPRAESFVVFDRHDHGVGRVVEAEHDLAFEGFAVGAFEVFEGFGPDTADAGVFVADGGDLLAALGLDAREAQLFAEDIRKFFEGDIDLHDVLPGLFAAVAVAGAGLALSDDLAFFAVAGADAGGVVAVAEGGDFDAVDGDGDEVFALFADEFAAGDELAEVGADAAFDDLAEALVVLVDHCGTYDFSCQSSMLNPGTRANSRLLCSDNSETVHQCGCGDLQIEIANLNPCVQERSADFGEFLRTSEIEREHVHYEK